MVKWDTQLPKTKKEKVKRINHNKAINQDNNKVNKPVVNNLEINQVKMVNKDSKVRMANNQDKMVKAVKVNNQDKVKVISQDKAKVVAVTKAAVIKVVMVLDKDKDKDKDKMVSNKVRVKVKVRDNNLVNNQDVEVVKVAVLLVEILD